MEIEAFIHGALCVAQSGRCFMSLYTHNASANRGACLQNCRAQYKVTDMDTGKELVVDNHYIMSAADICTIDFLDELLDAGVMVMKIEGRGRSAEYVDTVVKTYKSALKDIEDWTYDDKKIKDYYTKLETVYNRQLSKGNYYLGKELGDYSDAHGSKATTEKETIWRVTHFYPKVSVAEVIIESSSIKAGQAVLIIWATTGVLEFIPEWLYVDGHKVEQAIKGQKLTIKVPERVRQHDKFSIIKSRTNLQQSTISCE